MSKTKVTTEPKSNPNSIPNEKYEPELHLPRTTFFKFWGTRGSIPVSGLDYFRYGGNTVCLEIRDHDKSLIFDAGTGIRALGDELLTTPIREIHLFIGHTHWDHIMGFPFFSPIYSPEFTIHIYAHVNSKGGIEELFKGILSKDFFPVSLEEIAAKLVFHNLEDYKPITIGNHTVHLHTTNHPGSADCFKITGNHFSLGYATDNEFLEGYLDNPNKIKFSNKLLKKYHSIIDFFSDCDKMIHEAQYTPFEYQTKVGWGHTSVSNAVILMKYAQIKEWILTHHDPAHSDQILIEKLQLQKDILNECNVDCRCFMAYDGLTLPF